MTSSHRPEQEVFDDLATLCASPGYIHAIAHLTFRDSIVTYKDELKPEDLAHLFSESRLIRSEIMTLVGLLARNPIDEALPDPQTLSGYIQTTEALLQELHDGMSAAIVAEMAKAAADHSFNPMGSGTTLREAIFYGGESAYSFQYWELAERKYALDDTWLVAAKGFTISDAARVVSAACSLQDVKLRETLDDLRDRPPETWTMLPAFVVTASEIAERSGVDKARVESILEALALPREDRNATFQSLQDFNAANATPLLRLAENQFAFFHQYSLAEALYESPFFWMTADKAYSPKALHNRGQFTERFAEDRLRKVFGGTHVFSNVLIKRPNGNTRSEIDTLVVFGNQAIVLQAKAKRLTLEARRGNDQQIKDDFKKAVQDAYDQALDCCRALLEPGLVLTDANGNLVPITMPLRRVYPLCVVADHYPALSFQARQFLSITTTDVIMPPIVTDVFALDAVTEMLESPLRLLSYLSHRAQFADRLMATHELTVLSFHLQQNLWLDDQFSLAMLHDDISSPLDVAMAARRVGLPGSRTPEGILTRLTNSAVGRLIESIEARPEEATLELGLLLLELSEDTVTQLNKGINRVIELARLDGKHHDFTIGIGSGRAGITVHCNHASEANPLGRLQAHSALRKYSTKADKWFGINIDPSSGAIRFGISQIAPWKPDPTIEAMLPPKWTNGQVSAKRRKTGRNEPCPCGSGKKHKKCCLR